MGRIFGGRGKTYALLLLTAAIWGFQPSCIKWLHASWTPVTITAMRFAIISAVLLAAAYRQHPEHFWLRGREWLYLPLMGFFGMLLNNVLQFSGIALTTVTNCTLISATTPAITAFLSFWALRERLGERRWLGVALSFGGALLIVTHGNLLLLASLGFNRGDVLCFLSQVAWAVYSLIALKVAGRMTVIALTGWAGLFGCLFTALYGLAAGELHVTPLSGLPLAAFFYTTALAGLFSMLAWNAGIKAVGASVTAIFLNIMPVVGMMAGYLLFQEPLGWIQLAGAGLIFGGVFLTAGKRG